MPHSLEPFSRATSQAPRVDKGVRIPRIFGGIIVPILVMFLASGVAFAGKGSKEEKAHLQELISAFKQEREGSAVTRSETILDIGKLQIDEAGRFLAAEFAKEDPEDGGIAQVYITALGKNGTEPAVKCALTLGFERLDERQYGLVSSNLSNVKDEDAIDWIVSKAWKPLPNLSPPIQRELMKVIAGTGDPRMSRVALKYIAQQSVIDLQVDFIRILRAQKHKKSAKKIAKLVKWPDRDIQVEALLALQEMEATKYSGLFQDALESDFWQVRAVAVDIVAKTQQQELIEWLRPLMKDPEVAVRVAVVDALRLLGGPDAVEILIGALEKSTGRVKDDIGDALVWLTGKDFGLDPLGWGQWWRENADAVAVKGISREEFDRIKDEEANASTGLYYGLRIVSKYVTFVVDVSGSMEEPYKVPESEAGKPRGGGGTGVTKKGEDRKGWVQRRKIEVARRELVRALDTIPDGTKFNIIKFSGSYSLWKPALVSMNDRIRSEAIAFAKNLGAGGTTNVFDTLEAAMADPDVNTIYLLSDGAPTAGKHQDTPTILSQIAQMNQTRKCKIHTIGFHLSPGAEHLMRKLAEKNYGRFVKK